MRKKVKVLVGDYGLTMVELLAILAILGIITAIAVPFVLGHVENTYEEVCDVNRERCMKQIL
ncbi:type IV pilin protein [Bacillus weihaiensis]|uniref:type IV pilin protein n=1 Tax=Bacillus weihaiensis TaxID=1547283 RepID=UPI002354AF97|nr:hypothetical protein [Bacillus weihaiensis]